MPLRGKHGMQFEYKLLYDGKGVCGEKYMPGLINIENLEKKIKDTQPEQKVIHNFEGLRGYFEATSGALRGEVKELVTH
ncbi:MAG: hypothetical protein GY870_17335 [archaeon]|nr:hypothetical protein [archaeon]